MCYTQRNEGVNGGPDEGLECWGKEGEATCRR